MTKTGAMMGTPAYMSPEQVRGDKVDRMTDIYSAGAMFYELISYRKPFRAESVHTLLFKILSEEPSVMEKFDEAIPEELSPIILRALHKDKTKRHQSMEDLASELRSFGDSLAKTKARMKRSRIPINSLKSPRRKSSLSPSLTQRPVR